MRTIKHSRATAPQREFWRSPAKFTLFVGGVGSGKTRAGVVKALMMPPNSLGTVLAPTYPMLRDATLRTFLELADRGRILRKFNRGDMTAVLGGNRTVFFRSADQPDRLRGPNLGWYWPDEAAMMPEAIHRIMIARLRRDPGVAWYTSTPRGKNWLYKLFVTNGNPAYQCVRASSRTNPFLPPDFIQSLLDVYDPSFASQEVDGEFLDDTFGQLLPDAWVDRLPELVRPPGKPGGSRWLTCDLGEGGGRDSTAILVGDELGILAGEESPWVGPVGAATRIAQLVRTWDIRHDRIAYDAGGGRGLDIEPFLEQAGITDAVPYKGAGEGGSSFLNRRSKMAWRLRQRLDPERPKPPPPLVYDPERRPSVFDDVVIPEPAPQSPFCLPRPTPSWWPMLREELQALRYHHKGKRIALEPKEVLQASLRRSPNLLDALLMRFILDQDN